MGDLSAPGVASIVGAWVVVVVVDRSVDAFSSLRVTTVVRTCVVVIAVFGNSSNAQHVCTGVFQRTQVSILAACYFHDRSVLAFGCIAFHHAGIFRTHVLIVTSVFVVVHRQIR